MTVFLNSLAAIFAVAMLFSNSRSRDLELLKRNYYMALLGKDKNAAKVAGENYYSRLRRTGFLTGRDKQDLMENIRAME